MRTERLNDADMKVTAFIVCVCEKDYTSSTKLYLITTFLYKMSEEGKTMPIDGHRTFASFVIETINVEFEIRKISPAALVSKLESLARRIQHFTATGEYLSERKSVS